MSSGQLVTNRWRMLAYFFIACRYLGITPYLDLCRMVFHLKQLPQYTCFACLSTWGGFKVSKLLSSLKEWKERWFCVVPQDIDLPFNSQWGLPDTSRFCEGQAYFECLERDRQMLENPKPLVFDIDDILRDDVIDRADIKGVEGRTWLFLFMTICLQHARA